MIRRYIGIVEAALSPHFDPQAIYLHGGPQELQGQRLKRYGKGGSDAGALFFCKDSPGGRWYAATYAKGRVWKVRIHIPVDEILDLTNTAHRARLKGAVSPQEYAYMTTETASGHMDWAVVDEDVLIELGFRGAVFQERPAGMATGLPSGHSLEQLPDHVLSVAVFDANDVELIGYLDEPLMESAQGIETFDVHEFDYGDAPDQYLYHITTKPNAQSILQKGFLPNQKRTFTNYGFNTRGRVFFTERSGVRYWADRIEEHLEHEYDDPPEIIVLRVPRDSLGELHQDTVGTRDSLEPCYYITESFQQTVPFHHVS